MTGLKGCTILVADDERYSTTTLSLKLRQGGATVITAENADEAFELACAYEPDLICADYSMVPTSGLELAQRLKANTQTAHIPVVLLTTCTNRIASSQLAGTNIRGLLAKPFCARELLAKLQEVAIETGIVA